MSVISIRWLVSVRGHEVDMRADVFWGMLRRQI